MEELSLNRNSISSMCRLCLSKDVAELDIFTFSTGLMNQVADVIMKCAPVQITRCDEMPNLICQSCYTQLEKSHQFQMQVVKSDEVLRRYLQFRISDKQIKAESSIQGPSVDPSIHNTNTDTTVKCESSEVQDVFDININLKEVVPTNYTSADKITEEMSLKSEIKEEPIPTEGSDNLKEILSRGDGSKTNQPEIKEEPVDDNSSNSTEYTDRFIDFFSEGDDEEQSDREVKNKSNKRRKTCDVCNRSVRSRDFFFHQRIHTGEKPHQCDVCNKAFSRKVRLRKHQRIHTGEKPYQCDVCKKCFSEYRKLKTHKRVHTGEKPYQCDHCNKCFITLKYLLNHQRVHNGKKPYQCNVCNKCFIYKKVWKNHQGLHTGDKPHECDVCHKCFRKLRNLRKHRPVHDRPYQCDVCNKQFTKIIHLDTHKREHSSVV